MTALHAIQRDIERLIAAVEAEAGPMPPAAKRFCRSQRLQVLVGGSAEQSILATTGDDTLPDTIDDVPVKVTSEFPGYEVVIL